MGAKNYIFNVLFDPTKKNLDLINITGNLLNYIDEDINQCTDLHLLMDYYPTRGLKEILYYYKDDKIMTEGIVKILKKINLPTDNPYAYLEKMADLFGNASWIETENNTEKTYFQYIIDYGFGKADDEEMGKYFLSLGARRDIMKNRSILNRPLEKGWQELTLEIVTNFPELVKSPSTLSDGYSTPIIEAIKTNNWKMVKILSENGTEGFIHSLIIAAGSSSVEMEKHFKDRVEEEKSEGHKIYLKTFFKIIKDAKSLISIGDCIKTDLHRMNELNLFQSNFAARTGLANLLKYFQNNSEISEIIQSTLQSLEIVQPGYVSKSDEPLLWRINRRFTVDYFRKIGFTNKVKLHRNNFIITVSSLWKYFDIYSYT